MKNKDYESFVDKFKPKKTTDDCYTPEPVYDAVLSWLKENANIEGKKIIRPFWPGEDYTQWDYPDDCIVVDNPPFSIMSQIKKFYIERGIKFFLFANHLTLAGSYSNKETLIITYNDIVYHNGAIVRTSFITNMDEFSDYSVISSLSLREKIQNAQVPKDKKNISKYERPDNIITISDISYLIDKGITFEIKKNECISVKDTINHDGTKVQIFGKGFLVNNNIAERIKAERIKAERIKAERIKAERTAIKLYLTEEQKIQLKKLNECS